MTNDIKYCSYCGIEMVKINILACTVDMYEPYGGMTFKLASMFDRDTGKINLTHEYKCPNYKDKKWFHLYSPHDKYYSYKVFTE